MSKYKVTNLSKERFLKAVSRARKYVGSLSPEAKKELLEHGKKLMNGRGNN